MWLFHVESTGTIGAPTAQLLHYPVPKKSIEGFSAHMRVLVGGRIQTRVLMRCRRSRSRITLAMHTVT